MAVSDEIELPRPPPLGNPAHVHASPRGVGDGHGQLQPQHDVGLPMLPVQPQGVHGGYDPREAHGEEEGGAEGAETGGAEGGGEQREDGEEAEGGDDGEVGDAGGGVAEEDVVDGRDEGGDDHERDAGVVEPPEEEVEAAGVAGEEVGDGADGEAAHGAEQEDKRRPSRHHDVTGGG